MYFDPNNDADWETLAFEEAAAAETAARRDGNCTHGWVQGTGQDRPPRLRCNHCGTPFNDDADWLETRADTLEMYL